jgi:predicted enzyme related to lactoylglutathione lyase
MAAPKPLITKARTVGVPTTDQDRALAFYQGTLGMETRLDAPFGSGLRWIEVAPAGADTTLALMPTPPGQPVGVDTSIRLETEDAAAAHAMLRAAGTDVDAEILRQPVPMFTFRDPDGNTLYIVEPMRER